MSRPRILVVDDEAEMRSMLDAVLRRAGFDVEQAQDGQAAYELARARPPDLVVTDILMPRLDGWQLCRALRTDPATTRVPIIFLSLRNKAPDRIYGLKLGADDFISKPFDTRELVARVRVVLKRAAAAAAEEPADAGITGNLRDMSLVDIVQILDLGRKTAIVRVLGPSGEEAGTLAVERGAMVHAAYRGTTGRAVLPALLGLGDGRFEIVLGAEPVARTLEGSTQELLLEALRTADELRRPSPPGPAGKVDAPAASAEKPRPPRRVPPGLEPTLLDLFALGVIEPKA